MRHNRTMTTLLIVLALGTILFSCKKLGSMITIELSQKEVSVSEGESMRISAKVLPEGSSQSVKWRSLNSEIASVDQNGTITGITGGRTYVLASSGSISSGALVTVIAHVKGVELDKHDVKIGRDDMFQLKAQIIPMEAYNPKVTWHSTNPEVAVVGNGIVTGLNVGKADIVVTTEEGGFTDVCHVEVVSFIKNITFDKESMKLNVGQSDVITASIEPADATVKTLDWSSDNSAIASVDSEGRVTAHKRGNCVITATAGNGVSASCAVEVYSPVTGVQMEHSSLDIYVGDRMYLKAQVLPADANNTTVSWSSSNTTVAKVVTASGLVTAQQVGTADITVKTAEGGFTDVCHLNVIQGTESVSGITLDKNSLRLRVGGTYELFASILPVNAANKGITWTSDNTSLATVDTYGKVTAKDTGKCTITATTKDGGFTATCVVTIVGFDTEIGGIDDTGYIWED